MSMSKEQKKQIAVWGVYAAAVVGLLALLITYLVRFSRENDSHTESVGEVILSPVANAYAGKEDILGTTVTLEGDHEQEKLVLSFPEVISQYQPEKAYIITNVTAADFDYKKAAEQLQADAPKLFGTYYGDKFDESCISFKESDDEYGHNISVEYGGAGGEMAYFFVSGYRLIENSGVYAELNREPSVSGVYFYYKDDPNITVELSDGTLTIGAAADKFSDYFSAALSDYSYGFEMRPYKATVWDSNGTKFLSVSAEQLYEGIPIESCFSSYGAKNNGKTTTYYPAALDAQMLSVDSFCYIDDQSSGHIAKTEPLEKLISLKDAVEILKANLAKNASYSFSDIKLMYCCKSTENEIAVWEDKETIKQLVDENNAVAREYRPTWYFIIKEDNGTSSGIKVDAVTGEITMNI